MGHFVPGGERVEVDGENEPVRWDNEENVIVLEKCFHEGPLPFRNYALD